MNDTCPYEFNLSLRLKEVTSIIDRFIVEYELNIPNSHKFFIYGTTNDKLIKSVYSPKSDVFQFYLNSEKLCEYIKCRIDTNPNLNKLLEKVLIDKIDDDIVILELVINDSKMIDLNNKHKVKTLVL